MKIGIFADILENKKTGVEYYTKSVLEEILKIDKKNEYYFIQKDDKISKEFTSKNNVGKILRKKNFLSNFIDRSIKILPLWITLNLSKVFPMRSELYSYAITPKKINFLEVLFCPTHTAPFANKKIKGRKIMVVYDLTPILLPEFHNKKSIIFHNTMFKKILDSADEIIAISNSTKDDLINHMKINKDKINVIYPGLNTHIKYDSNNSEAVKKYKLPKDFILYLGTLEPRKNIMTLLKAFKKLKSEGLKEKLVIAGGKGWMYDEIFNYVKDNDLDKEIIFTGYVDENDVSKIYSSAKLFVFPSLYEGFGLPILEAMACKCPVITSNTSSMPEVAGDAALLFNPKDENELSRQIKKVLSSRNLQKKMIEKGTRRTKDFSWKRSGKKVVEIFNR